MAVWLVDRLISQPHVQTRVARGNPKTGHMLWPGFNVPDPDVLIDSTFCIACMTSCSSHQSKQSQRPGSTAKTPDNQIIGRREDPDQALLCALPGEIRLRSRPH